MRVGHAKRSSVYRASVIRSDRQQSGLLASGNRRTVIRWDLSLFHSLCEWHLVALIQARAAAQVEHTCAHATAYSSRGLFAVSREKSVARLCGSKSGQNTLQIQACKHRWPFISMAAILMNVTVASAQATGYLREKKVCLHVWLQVWPHHSTRQQFAAP